ncbi:MAG: glycosyltransferase [Candidatus Kryptoniota bacterium]
MKLSLSMIVKNEERFLPGCLESVKGLVDEIVIVDTGSTDGTKKIAESCRAKIIDFKWCDDFSAARNESLRHVTGDWVLYLDADERLDKSFHGTVRKLISSGKADAYLLNLKSKIGTKPDSQYHLVSYPRLFKKMKGLAFLGKVHEQITTSLSALRARIAQSDVIIEHLGYAQSDDVIREKAKRNYDLLLAQIERHENYGYALYQLGQTEIVLGEKEKGLRHLDEALAAGGYGKSVTASIYAIIAENKFKGGDCEAALAACDKSLELAQQQTFAHMMKAEIYSKLGEYRKAEDSLLKAVEQYRSSILKGKVATTIEPVFDAHVLYSKVGRAASLAGDIAAAKTYLLKAAEERPYQEKVAPYLEFFLKNGMYHEAIEAAKQFRNFESEDWYLRLVSSALMDAGEFQQAAVMLEKISEHDMVSWSSLANCRLKIGDFEGADSAFRSAVELGYDDAKGLELFGLAQFKLSKFSEAIETLTKVVQLDPSSLRAERFILAARAQLLAVG